MRSLLEIYRRYFRFHIFGLLLIGVCYLGFAAEGSIMAAMSRYLVDEVLQVELVAEPILHGQPKGFVTIEEPISQWPGEQAVDHRPITDGMLPGENAADPVLVGELAADGALQDRIDGRTGRPNAEKLRLLALIAALLVGTHLATVAASAWSSVKIAKITEQVVFSMRRHIHEKLLRLQMSFHDQHQTGRLLSRAIDDVQVIEGQFTGVMTQLVRFSGLIVINVSLMFYISPKLTWLALLAMPFYGWAYYKFAGQIREMSITQRRNHSSLYGLVRDRLANPRVVKGFGQEKRELREFFVRATDLFRRNRRIVLKNNLLSMVCTMISASVTGVTLGYGVILLRRGELTLGYLLFFHTVCHGLFWPVAALTQLTATVQWLRVSCERVLEVLNEPMTIVDHPKARPLERLSQGVRFENITFSFDGSERAAVSGIDLEVVKGSQVCLMGRSGAGKSTLGMLLLRLYDPGEGRISIDGQDLRKVRTSSLRRRISYVPQEPVLFSGTLASNILYGNSRATHEEMIAAAKAAEIHEFIESLPDGYGTVIGENGLRLSGGQKQRISLARALVTDPDVLILDDCTSALDAETEAKIQKTIKTALAGKTVLIISHRASVASKSDKIVVLDNGRIVETGTHDELVEAQGTYWNLVRDQIEEQSAVAIAHKQVAASAA
ncbi:MAG: ABC transporter ATP-binding protein [Phycisphaerae bacterium]|nr:ABC transporter ATP-binding protein [Phycisphaerae bacterium]